MKKIKLIIVIALVGFFSSCSDLGLVNMDIPYDLEPDKEVALAEPADLYNLLKGAYGTLGNTMVTSSFIHIGMLADQLTTTNAYRSFWAFSQEPRNVINNATTWGDLSEISGMWSNFNNVISSVNYVLDYINSGNKIIVEDEDLTIKSLVGVYFARGMAYGYIGSIYDQGFVVNPGDDLTALTFVDYNAIIDASLADLQTALAILDTTSADFQIDLFPLGGYAIDKATLKKIIYSYMARFEASRARTEEEAINKVNWDNVLTWAENGITEDWSPISTSDMANLYHNWITYPLSSDGNPPYIQVDIKLIYLAAKLNGKDYYWEYPSDETVNLPDAYANGDIADARFDQNGLKDFWYSTSFGYLRAERGRYLFSNYGFQRYQFDHPTTIVGNPMHIMDKAEVDYLKAEAQYMKGDYTAAAATLASSNFVTRGGYSAAVVNENPDTLLLILHNEYSIELMGTPGIQWFFMRRHDLLKRGTPTMYPVPANELEVDLLPSYTFGGEINVGKPGTASGAKAWAPIHGDSKAATVSEKAFSVPANGDPVRGSVF